MPEIMTTQDFVDGRLDVKSLGEAANGDENTQVVTRTGETYPSAKKAIKELFENGGIAGRFKTLAELQASSLTDSSYALVADDIADKNGIYIKQGGSWVKSKYDPLLQSMAYSDATSKRASGIYDTLSLLNSSALANNDYAIVVNDADLGKNGLYQKKSGSWVKTGISKDVLVDKPIDAIAGEWTNSGQDLSASVRVAATPRMIKTYKGDSLVIKGEPTPGRTVGIIKYDNNGEYISTSANYGSYQSDRIIPLDEGYINLNLRTPSGYTNTDEGLSYLRDNYFIRTIYDPFKFAKEYTDSELIRYNKAITEADSLGLYGEKPFSLYQANLTSDGHAIQHIDSRATTLSYVKCFAGEKVLIKYDNADLRVSVLVFQYDENKDLIGTSGYSSSNGVLSEVPLQNGYVRFNVQLLDSGDALIRPVLDYINGFEDSITHYYNKLKRDYVDAASQYNRVMVNAPLELGGIETTISSYPSQKIGNITSALLLGTKPNFLGQRRSRKYLEVIGDTNISVKFSDGLARVFEYDKDFEVVIFKEVTSGSAFRLQSRTKYVKVSLENVTEGYPTVSINIDSKVNKPNWVFNIYKSTRGWFNINFVYEAFPNQGGQVFGADVNNQQYSDDRYYNTGILKLPPNYDPFGEASKLIIFIQGSGGYLSIDASSINAAYEQTDGTIKDEGIFNYWLNEGYAILGIYPWTSKYILNHGVNQGTPTAMAAYSQAYQWVINNYNISQDGVYVAAKSSGGFCGALLGHTKSIPVKAVALLAPVINPLREPFGAFDATRFAYADDFGFVGDNSVLMGNPVVPRTPALWDYIRANAEKIAGYNPYWAGLIGEDVATLAEDATTEKDTNYELNKTKQRICPTPIKIWAAEDDYVRTYEQSRIYVQSIRNTFGNAEMRTMPNGSGAHNSVDTSELALKVPTIKTRLGITHKNAPLAMVEVIQYFRRFE